MLLGIGTGVLCVLAAEACLLRLRDFELEVVRRSQHHGCRAFCCLAADDAELPRTCSGPGGRGEQQSHTHPLLHRPNVRQVRLPDPELVVRDPKYVNLSAMPAYGSRTSQKSFHAFQRERERVRESA